MITVRIINQTGQVMTEFNTEVLQGIPLLIDIKSLSAGVYNIILTNDAGRQYHGRVVLIK
jgi:hypothetical protein